MSWLDILAPGELAQGFNNVVAGWQGGNKHMNKHYKIDIAEAKMPKMPNIAF